MYRTMANTPPAINPVPPSVVPWIVCTNALGLGVTESILFKVMPNYHNFTKDQYTSLRDHGEYGALDNLNQ